MSATGPRKVDDDTVSTADSWADEDRPPRAAPKGEAKWSDQRWYPFRVEPGCFFDRSSMKGTPYLHINFVCTGEEMYGVQMGYDMWLTPKKVKQNADTLRKLGFDPLTPRPDDWNNIDQKIVSSEVEAQVVHEEFPKDSGKWSWKLNRFRGKGAQTSEQLIAEVAGVFRKAEVTEQLPFAQDEEVGVAHAADSEDEDGW